MHFRIAALSGCFIATLWVTGCSKPSPAPTQTASQTSSLSDAAAPVQIIEPPKHADDKTPKAGMKVVVNSPEIVIGDAGATPVKLPRAEVNLGPGTLIYEGRVRLTGKAIASFALIEMYRRSENGQKVIFQTGTCYIDQTSGTYSVSMEFPRSMEVPKSIDGTFGEPIIEISFGVNEFLWKPGITRQPELRNVLVGTGEIVVNPAPDGSRASTPPAMDDGSNRPAGGISAD